RSSPFLLRAADVTAPAHCAGIRATHPGREPPDERDSLLPGAACPIRRRSNRNRKCCDAARETAAAAESRCRAVELPRRYGPASLPVLREMSASAEYRQRDGQASFSPIPAAQSTTNYGCRTPQLREPVWPLSARE